MNKKSSFSLINITYVIWFVFHFVVTWGVLGGDGTAFLISLLVYGLTIGFSLSPIGEEIYRRKEGIRPLVLPQEIEYIKPLFDEVYNEARKENPELNENMKLYIQDSMDVNAYAIGRTTVAITKGALQFMNEDELKGLFAHEVGHIIHGDTKLLLVTNIGNGIFNLIIFGGRFLMRLAKGLTAVFEGGPLFFVSWITSLAVELLIFFLLLAGEIILMFTSRQNEYLADKYAYSIGYGKELKDALIKIESISTTGKRSIMDLLKATHPRLIDRILRLEQMGGIESTDGIIT